MSAMRSYVDVFLSPSTQHYISNNTMVGILWQKCSTFFWKPSFWLYPGVEWEDLEQMEITYPSFYDMWVYPLLFSTAFLTFTYFFLEPVVLDSLAQWANIPNSRRSPPQPSKILETLYLHAGKRPSENELKDASSTTNMTVRQVERWLRHRHAITLSTNYEKFIDQGFTWFCHTGLTIMGCYIMYSKPWVWDITLCWKDYPYHSVDDGVWWYYVCGLTFFWSAIFRQMLMPGRSVFDNLQIMLHHLLTILLMVFSWACNFVRIGTLVLMVHGWVDVFLCAAKMMMYSKFSKGTDVVFGLFVISWIYTRIYLYPFWIMHSVFTHPPDVLYEIPAGYFFKILLTGLLIINIVWTVLITKVILKKVIGGQLQDVRSDVEDFSDDNSDEPGDSSKKNN